MPKTPPTRQLQARELRIHAAFCASAPRGGMPPPPVDLSLEDIAGHEERWLAFFAVVDTQRLRSQWRAALEQRCIAAERAVLCKSGEPLNVQALLQKPENLLPYGGSIGADSMCGADMWLESDFVCRGCDKMDESWAASDDARYPGGAPRWRLICTSLFFCHWCYERIERGESVRILPGPRGTGCRNKFCRRCDTKA